MNNILSEGELAFLPSDLILLQFVKSEDGPARPTNINPAVQRYHRILSPAHALVVECKKETPYCVVLYNGERWMATKKDIYPLEAQS